MSNSSLFTPVHVIVYIFVVILHESQLETGRCTVHADDDRVETPSWKIK